MAAFIQMARPPFQKGLRLIASCTQLNLPLSYDGYPSYDLIIATLCETGPRFAVFLRKFSDKQSRAFSCEVMLSSNMATSIATEINIHLSKHLFTLMCVMVSPWTFPFVVQAHYDRLHAWCTWLPWISRSVCAIWRPCWRTAWWIKFDLFLGWRLAHARLLVHVHERQLFGHRLVNFLNWFKAIHLQSSIFLAMNHDHFFIIDNIWGHIMSPRYIKIIMR